MGFLPLWEKPVAKWTCSTRGQRRFFPPPWQFMAKRAESGTLQARLSQEGYNHVFFPCVVFFFLPLAWQNQNRDAGQRRQFVPTLCWAVDKHAGRRAPGALQSSKLHLCIFSPAWFFSPLPGRNL